MSPTRPLVRGTVPVQISPIAAAKSRAEAGDGGRDRNRTKRAVRAKYSTARTFFLRYQLPSMPHREVPMMLLKPINASAAAPTDALSPASLKTEGRYVARKAN